MRRKAFPVRRPRRDRELDLYHHPSAPTNAVATLGILIAADRTHWELLIIPLLWCAISGATLVGHASPGAGR